MGFCGFRGGALLDGDRGRGVTVGMGEGGGGLWPCGGQGVLYSPRLLTPCVSECLCLSPFIMKIKTSSPGRLPKDVHTLSHLILTTAL